MKKHKGKMKTGKIRHKDMTSLLHGVGKDPHAHPTHVKANKAHGMPEGMQVQGGYDNDGDEGGEMGGNCCYE